MRQIGKTGTGLRRLTVHAPEPENLPEIGATIPQALLSRLIAALELVKGDLVDRDVIHHLPISLLDRDAGCRCHRRTPNR